MASETKFENTITSLFKGMNSFIASKTVVGEPVKVDGTTLIPLMDVSFGMGAGASALDRNNRGSGGMGGKMTPTAVIVIKNGTVKLVNVKNQDAVTKLLDLVPDVVNKFSGGRNSGAEEGFSADVEDAIRETVEKETKTF